MQSFHDDLSTMMSLSAKKFEKTILLSQEKSLKLTMASKVPQSCSSVISNRWSKKKHCIYFWNLDINAKLKEKNEKKNDISLNISKNSTTIFDHQLDLINVHNEGTFELFFIIF